MAWRKAGCVERIVGIGRGRANLERALELGVIDEIAADTASGVSADGASGGSAGATSVGSRSGGEATVTVSGGGDGVAGRPRAQPTTRSAKTHVYCFTIALHGLWADGPGTCNPCADIPAGGDGRARRTP